MNARLISEAASSALTKHFRSEWSRDYGRIVHSLNLRLLCKKTQLFPEGHGGDSSRNRLSHSLEVAQVSRGIFDHLLSLDINDFPMTSDHRTIVETASLAHDIGHPPFAHAGERVLDDLMDLYGGFEGNAQTFRLLTKVMKRDPLTPGMNLTVASLLSILKRNYEMRKPGYSTDDIKTKRSQILGDGYDKKQKGYYYCDRDKIEEMKKALNDNLSMIKNHDEFKGYYDQIKDFINPEIYSSLNIYHHLLYGIGNEHNIKNTSTIVDPSKLNISHITKAENFKFVATQIMDMADDITNSSYDLIDALDLGFLTVNDFLAPTDQALLNRIAESIRKNPEFSTGKEISQVTASHVRDILLKIGKDMVKMCLIYEQPPITSRDFGEGKDFNVDVILATTATKKFFDHSGYRNKFGGSIVNDFIRNINWNKSMGVHFSNRESKMKLFVLKHYIFECVVRHRGIQAWENGAEVVLRELFEKLTSGLDDIRATMPSKWNSDEFGSKLNEPFPNAKALLRREKQLETLLPPEWQKEFKTEVQRCIDTLAARRKQGLKLSDEDSCDAFAPIFRVICDFISSMTDNYAHEYHARLTGQLSISVLKPF